jgi:LacI family gluconate utilization system Gnt-I transcriptional repressor
MSDRKVDKRGVKRPASLQDVAHRARVSSMTVSRALRRPEAVSQETRARIERAIAQLAYVPNNIAGGLRSRRSRTIACVIPTIASPVFAKVVQGLADALHAHGYRVSLGTSNYDSTEEQRVMSGLLAHRPEAVVLTAGDRRPELAKTLKRLGVPVVEIWERLERPLDMNVGFSNQAVGRVVVQHLVQRGAKRIAFVGVTTKEHARARARRQGYEAAVNALLGQAPIVDLQEESMGGGRAALARLIADADPPDAIFFVGDTQAAGALLAAPTLGVAVPDRLMIAGFGDAEIGRYLTPGLTTVSVPEYRIGHEAGTMIVRRLAGADAPAAIDIDFTLVPRGSTARGG